MGRCCTICCRRTCCDRSSSAYSRSADALDVGVLEVEGEELWTLPEDYPLGTALVEIPGRVPPSQRRELLAALDAHALPATLVAESYPDVNSEALPPAAEGPGWALYVPPRRVKAQTEAARAWGTWNRTAFVTAGDAGSGTPQTGGRHHPGSPMNR